MPNTAPDGFKILVDVILSAGEELKIIEAPYRFRKRVAGESKLTPLVALDFLGLVAHHASRGLLPIRFVLFALIGAIGIVFMWKDGTDTSGFLPAGNAIRDEFAARIPSLVALFNPADHCLQAAKSNGHLAFQLARIAKL